MNSSILLLKSIIKYKEIKWVDICFFFIFVESKPDISCLSFHGLLYLPNWRLRSGDFTFKRSLPENKKLIFAKLF